MSLKNITKILSISAKDMRQIIKDFHSEMERGLTGEYGSLKMIPSYTDRPAGSEKGRFLALDLGGTNFRILEVELKGNGRSRVLRQEKFELDKRYIKGSGGKFFNLIADSIKEFLKKSRVSKDKGTGLGFTFSFPLEQKSVDSGVLLCWTKGFDIRGVTGRDVVKLLKGALSGRGIPGIRICAILNDTVGTLAARSYADPDCDMSVILGTGTNACYVEKISNVEKIALPPTRTGNVIINIEWGNFNKLKNTSYDRRLDRESDNPGKQILEKMVSGMYLGEAARLIIKDLVKNKKIFQRRGSLKTEHMSIIENDRTARLSKISVLLKKIGTRPPTFKERLLIKKTCEAVSRRASRISAAAMVGVVTKMDPRLSRRHAIAIDGSVYEKHPHFSKNVRSAINEILGPKARRINLVIEKDGSGKGAAIIAAVAALGG